MRDPRPAQSDSVSISAEALEMLQRELDEQASAARAGELAPATTAS